MTDDQSKRDFRDRDRVSGNEDYEVEYFARENGITSGGYRRPKITLARSTFEWESQTQLRKGFGKTISYFASLLASRHAIGHLTAA